MQTIFASIDSQSTTANFPILIGIITLTLKVVDTVTNIAGDLGSTSLFESCSTLASYFLSLFSLIRAGHSVHTLGMLVANASWCLR